MWIADQWKDYQVLDTSKGEKLERWGDYLLVRPDPQVIWDTPKKNPGWKKMNGHYHRSKKGGGEWEFFDLPKQWQIQYGPLTFNLKPFNFKHTGLFPEQAANWDWFSEKIRNAGRPVKVLNLFAYTCGFSVAALAGGATPDLCRLLAREGRHLPTHGRRTDHRPQRRGLPVLERRQHRPEPQGVAAPGQEDSRAHRRPRRRHPPSHLPCTVGPALGAARRSGRATLPPSRSSGPWRPFPSRR